MLLDKRQIIKGVKNPKDAASFAVNQCLRWYYRNIRGTNVFSQPWDMLIVLDGCRLDIMRELSGEYDFIERVDSIYSVGSQSEEWMENTFTNEWNEQMSNTAVVTGNVYSETGLNESQLLILDEVWRYAWDDSLGTIKARPITDRAITTSREMDPGRLVVHYMQPHFPSVPDPLGSGIKLDEFGSGRMSTWEKLEDGDVTTEEVRKAAIKNLRYVLDEVEILLNNIDAGDVVITADHGNSHGENGEVGHPRGSVNPAVRRVPWIRTTAVDNKTHELAEYEIDEQDTNWEEQLRALGYR